jgi:DNA-binding transcriptional LysR family regulator
MVNQLDLLVGIKDAKFTADDIAFQKLHDDAFVCVVHKTHPLAQACKKRRQKSVSSADIWPYRQIIDIPPYLLKHVFSRGHHIVPVNDELDNIICANTSEAYNLVLAVSNRAAGVFSMNNTLIKKNTDYTTLDDREQLVLDERHRELIFEGKRWYDLLRQARRSGSSEKLADAVTEKQDANRGGIKIKMMDTNYLYLPYFRNELKVNPYLKQNPAYNFGGEDEFNKN